MTEEEQRLSDILDREGISGLLKQEFADIQAKYREDKKINIVMTNS